jgi:alkanesulfonate monooxygenase SsuD/methylene tetrahydromethanopterin reductase-like flavin-dependent oxidoreductase (luciferase family)
MDFGIIFPTRVDDWQLIPYAEELGYHRAWVPDSQMIWSDCYATLALAAEHTSRIQLGTGVAIPRTRIAPVTAHSIASIPPAFRAIWEEYCAHVEQMVTPPEKRYLQLHEGHSTYLVPAERRFVTPEAIQGTTLVGTPEEICTRLRTAARAGLRELTVLPPTNTNRAMLKEFAELVMSQY